MKVYLSNSFRDSEVADLIKLKLHELNFDIIQPPQSPQIGDNVVVEIDRAICEADAYVILISKHYLISKWTDFELMMIYDQTLGRKRGKRIFPIITDKYANIPSIFKDITYADISDKKKLNIDNLIEGISKQLLLHEEIEYKDIKSIIKGQEYILKHQELEYRLQVNRHKKTSTAFQLFLFIVTLLSVVISILLFTNNIEINELLYFSTSVKSFAFYFLGVLTAIAPSLYIMKRLKNRKDGK